MRFEYGVETYRALSKILNLKFASELDATGLAFKDFYLMKNLVTGKDHYLININDTQIHFVTANDFILHFIAFLGSNIKALDKRHDYLTKIDLNEFTNNISIEIEYKTIDFQRQRQRDLLTKMIKFRNKIK
jgi:hypothetical protein